MKSASQTTVAKKINPKIACCEMLSLALFIDVSFNVISVNYFKFLVKLLCKLRRSGDVTRISLVFLGFKGFLFKRATGFQFKFVSLIMKKLFAYDYLRTESICGNKKQKILNNQNVIQQMASFL
jgi:hypothetical protein